MFKSVTLEGVTVDICFLCIIFFKKRTCRGYHRRWQSLSVSWSWIGLTLKSFIVGLGARIAALFLSGAIAQYYLCDIQW